MSRWLPLVSIAVLTLVAGLLIGASAVSGRLVSTVVADRDRVAARSAETAARASEADVRADASERFVAATAPTTLRGALAGRSVAVVVAADADRADVAALTDLLGRAGARVTGRLELTDAMLAPEHAGAVRDLAPRLLPAGAPPTLGAGAEAGDAAGNLVVDVVTSRAHATPNEAVTALTALAGAGLVRPVPPVAPSPASLVLVVAGGSPDPGRGVALARFVGATGRGVGTVLATRAGSGAVAAARVNTSLPVLEPVDRPSTQVATVLALRDRAAGAASS